MQVFISAPLAELNALKAELAKARAALKASGAFELAKAQKSIEDCCAYVEELVRV